MSMSPLATAGLWITSIWLAIYAMKYSSRRPRVLIPFSQNRRPTTEVVVKHLTIRFKTETFNTSHDRLSGWLSPNTSPVLRQFLLKFYDLGSIVGVIGMLLAFCLLLFTAASLSWEVLHLGQNHSVNRVVKRMLNHVADIALPVAPASDLLRVNPIIPGLTVPLNHTPLILVALAASQIIHEFGHAITAALHRIPMISCGIAATLVLPSAFVTLPAPRLEKLPPRDRLQIVSSGCFHNFLLLCLFSAAWSGVGSFASWILFQDISSQGRLVVSVDYDSPLATHLPAGTLITKIDDSSMVSPPGEPWDRFLLSPSGPVEGWCASNALLNKALAPTCVSTNDPHSCFVSKADETEQYELNPVQIFTDDLPRCSSSLECSPVSSCVVPRFDQQLVRISILRSHAGASVEDMIVWKGPKEEIWEQVHVSNLRPRFPVVPSRLLELTSTFFEYLKVANLSLYLVNMLPIAPLDGCQSLAALLGLFYGRVSGGLESADLEAPSTPRPRQERTVPRTCRTFLNLFTLSLVALCGLLGIICWVRK